MESWRLLAPTSGMPVETFGVTYIRYKLCVTPLFLGRRKTGPTLYNRTASARPASARLTRSGLKCSAQATRSSEECLVDKEGDTSMTLDDDTGDAPSPATTPPAMRVNQREPPPTVVRQDEFVITLAVDSAEFGRLNALPRTIPVAAVSQESCRNTTLFRNTRSGTRLPLAIAAIDLETQAISVSVKYFSRASKRTPEGPILPLNLFNLEQEALFCA
ncbi:hypothetical protein LshimejAT787_0301460 [Lyophyllum shimeji]|uniref:Uncharacterized protein n=1 Tax=Lyophyllum shimeji TaxID=47721 RepID=A0A9P3UJN7_LYOSH|nr:hypothetical protein LshimejAT787_0301460 [Lyophyllum shimeji]